MSFPAIQAEYAAHGVATYPMEGKKPAIKGYDRVGINGSAQLAMKFAEANAGGFCAGLRNRLTVVDIDSTDERLRDEMLRQFGHSPFQVRTPSGGWHLYYRYGGERRRIKPLPNVDVLGGGNVVAAGSETAKGRYVLERCTFDDLDRLLPLAGTPTPPAKPQRVPKGKRGVSLFNYCRGIVGHCDTLDQLIDAVRTWVEQRCEQPTDDPVTDVDIIKTCNSVWRYREGRRSFMQHLIEGPKFAALTADLEVWGVCSYLLAENGPGAEFLIADGLGAARGWSRRAVPRARRVMVNMGIVKCVRPPKKCAAGLYKWDLPDE